MRDEQVRFDAQTVLTLAFRGANHIVRMAKSGEIKSGL